ncbi:MAG: ABC transporter substrate-binding protein [Tissierellales bacterium]|nr:ABC transporter substrate-binding protein [Tissierellales bacterium]MBN2826950.1 ABC transporter substrate-binding protein [Tissierellales bacterium]
MKKPILIIIIVLISILSLNGCTTEVAPTTALEPAKVTIAGLKGPTSMGMIKMIDENKLNSENYSVEYFSESAPENLTGKIISGEIQIAAVPTNLASVLYNKTDGKIQFLALNTLGVIHIVGSAEIDNLADLKNETLYISGKGSTPDYAINYMLKQNGLSDFVSLEFFPDHASLAQAVVAKDAKLAVLPQPFVTQVLMQSEDVKLLIDLNEEWAHASEGKSLLAMGCLIVNKEFAENNKEFVKEFLTEYELSVNWVNENPVEAGILVEKHGILPNSKLATAAIPYSAIVYQSASDSKTEVNNFLEILMNFNPSSVGGALPDEDFYFSE